MLAAALGIRLLVWTGAMIPSPPAPGLIDSLLEAEVTNDGHGHDGFKLTFALTKGTVDYDLLMSGSLAPMTKVTIAVVMGVMPEVLINGVVTRHEVHPRTEPGASRLIVYGHDPSILLSLEDKNAKFEVQPDFVIFSRLIASYAKHGLVPNPRATSDIPLPFERIPHQAESDLAFIRRMAKRNGFLFYIEPISVGLSQAFFGPPVRLGLPQSALTTNMGGHDNVLSISTQNDALAPVGAKGTFIEPFTKMSLPIPELPSLRVPPLALSPAPIRKSVLTRDTAQRNPAQAALSGLATSMNAADAVRLFGEADGAKYGSVLRARQLVGVRGIGYSYGGNYYVDKVTHVVRRGAYTQRFELTREGTGAILPMVRP